MGLTDIRRSKSGVASTIGVAFIILIAVAFFIYVFGTADAQISSQDNNYAPGWNNTPEYNYMSLVISLIAAIALIVCVIYVVVKSQNRNEGGEEI